MIDMMDNIIIRLLERDALRQIPKELFPIGSTIIKDDKKYI
jgi:hypothetical protein